MYRRKTNDALAPKGDLDARYLQHGYEFLNISEEEWEMLTEGLYEYKDLYNFARNSTLVVVKLEGDVYIICGTRPEDTLNAPKELLKRSRDKEVKKAKVEFSRNRLKEFINVELNQALETGTFNMDAEVEEFPEDLLKNFNYDYFKQEGYIDSAELDESKIDEVENEDEEDNSRYQEEYEVDLPQGVSLPDSKPLIFNFKKDGIKVEVLDSEGKSLSEIKKEVIKAHKQFVESRKK